MSNKAKKKSGNRPAAKPPRKQIGFLPFLAVVTAAVCIIVVFLANGNGILNESNSAGREGDESNTVETQAESDVTGREMSEAVIIASDESVAIPASDNASGESAVIPASDNASGESAVIPASDNAPGESAVIPASDNAPGESVVIPTSDITTDASFFSVEVDGTNMEIIAVRDSTGNIRTAFNTCQVCYDSGRGYYVQSGNYLVCQNCGNRFSMDQVEIESGGCNPWPIFAENKTVTADEISISYDFLLEARGIFANWKSNY